MIEVLPCGPMLIPNMFDDTSAEEIARARYQITAATAEGALPIYKPQQAGMTDGVERAWQQQFLQALVP